MALPIAVTSAAFVLHVAGGVVGLLSGTVAVSVRKGSRVHRAAGQVFLGSMLVMALFADYLAVAVPDQLPNFFIGTFTMYLVTTAWLTVRREEGRIGLGEKLALAVVACLCVPFAILSVQLALGIEPLFPSKVPYEGPVLVAIYTFTVLVLAATLGDARVLWARGISGRRRIARHLWRMCLGLALAAGSAFTNGLPRLLPTSVHIPLFWLFVPQLLVLGLLLFWFIRVRWTTWYSGHSPLERAVP